MNQYILKNIRLRQRDQFAKAVFVLTVLGEGRGDRQLMINNFDNPPQIHILSIWEGGREINGQHFA